jgi:hypothetical protein
MPSSSSVRPSGCAVVYRQRGRRAGRRRPAPPAVALRHAGLVAASALGHRAGRFQRLIACSRWLRKIADRGRHHRRVSSTARAVALRRPPNSDQRHVRAGREAPSRAGRSLGLALVLPVDQHQLRTRRGRQQRQHTLGPGVLPCRMVQPQRMLPPCAATAAAPRSAPARPAARPVRRTVCGAWCSSRIQRQRGRRRSGSPHAVGRRCARRLVDQRRGQAALHRRSEQREIGAAGRRGRCTAAGSRRRPSGPGSRPGIRAGPSGRAAVAEGLHRPAVLDVTTPISRFLSMHQPSITFAAAARPAALALFRVELQAPPSAAAHRGGPALASRPRGAIRRRVEEHRSG